MCITYYEAAKKSEDGIELLTEILNELQTCINRNRKENLAFYSFKKQWLSDGRVEV
jgi:hypothetical protein